MSSSTVTEVIFHCQRQIKKDPSEQKLLHYIGRLSRLRIKVKDLISTGIGRTINQLSRMDGLVGEKAYGLVTHWKALVEAERSSGSSAESGSASDDEEEDVKGMDKLSKHKDDEESENSKFLNGHQYSEEDEEDNESSALPNFVSYSRNQDESDKESVDSDRSDRLCIDDELLSNAKDDEAAAEKSTAVEKEIETERFFPTSSSESENENIEEESDEDEDKNYKSNHRDKHHESHHQKNHETNQKNFDDKSSRRKTQTSAESPHKRHSRDKDKDKSKNSESKHHFHKSDRQKKTNHGEHHRSKVVIKLESRSRSRSKTRSPSPPVKQQHDKLYIKEEPKSRSRSPAESQSKQSRYSKVKVKEERMSKSRSKSPPTETQKLKSVTKNGFLAIPTQSSAIKELKGLSPSPKKEKELKDLSPIPKSTTIDHVHNGSRDRINLNKGTEKETKSSRDRYREKKDKENEREKEKERKRKCGSLEQEEKSGKKAKVENMKSPTPTPTSSQEKVTTKILSLNDLKPKLLPRLNVEIDSTSGVNFSDVLSGLDTKKIKRAGKKQSPVKKPPPIPVPQPQPEPETKSANKRTAHAPSTSTSTSSAPQVAGPSGTQAQAQVLRAVAKVSPYVYTPPPPSKPAAAAGSAAQLQILKELAREDGYMEDSRLSMGGNQDQYGDDALSTMMSSRNQRTKVYSGVKTGFVGKIPSLFDLCIRVIQDNLDELGYTGGIPFEILEPVLSRASVEQLIQIENYNSYLIESTDNIWKFHCHQNFRGKVPGELETWRELYFRCVHERTARFQSLTNKLKTKLEVATPVRKTKLAYVETTAGPKFSKSKAATIKTGMSSLKTREEKGPVRSHGSSASSGGGGNNLQNVLIEQASVIISAKSRGGSAQSSTSGTIRESVSAASRKPKKAPLMQKTLKSMKTLMRR